MSINESPNASSALQAARMLTVISLPSALYLLLLHYRLTSAQNSVGSFFTAIYLNGAPVASYQESCANMGQSQYCCASGQSCAWDDAGKVACCASGYTCEGSAYSSSAGAAGQYYTSSSSTWNQAEQTTTVYASSSQNCNCHSSTALNVVPIVPLTAATVESYYTPTTTSYYVPTTSTTPPYTITTTAGAGQEAEVTSSGTCAGGYTTLVEANVGAPTRIVNCYVIINEGGKRWQGQNSGSEVLLGALGFLAVARAML